MLRYGLIPTILWSIGTNKGYLEVCKWIIPPSFQQVLVYSVKGGPLPFSESALFDSPSWNFLNDASLLRPIWYYVHRPGSSFSDQLEILEFIFPLGPAAVAVIPVGWSFFPLPINWTVVTWSFYLLFSLFFFTHQTLLNRSPLRLPLPHKEHLLAFTFFMMELSWFCHNQAKSKQSSLFRLLGSRRCHPRLP